MSTQTNIARLLVTELRKQGVCVSSDGMRESLLSHPYYPSLQAVSDCLNDVGIATMSVRITAGQLRDALNEAQAILFLEEKGESYPVWVKSMDRTAVTYSANGKKSRTEDIESLSNKWKGVTLLLQTDGSTGELGYEKRQQQKRQQNGYYAVALAGLLCVLGVAVYGSGEPVQFATMLLPKLAGLFFAVLLVATELGFKLPVAEKLCAISTNEGCDKVMHSKAASITKHVKLADVGLVYFVAVLLCQLFFSGSALYPSGMQTLSVLSLLCLPFVLFSVGYQTFVLKAYCPLCLSVMAMLVVDFLTNLGMGFFGWEAINLSSVLLVSAIAILTAGVWMVVKATIEKRQSLQNSYYRYHQLRQDPERIAQAVGSLNAEDMGAGTGDIVLGCKEAKLVFTEVINPYCSPCGTAIKELLQLLDIFPEGLQVRIRFTGRENEPNSERTITAQHLLSYAAVGSEKEVRKALTEWYAGMNYATWKQQFPIADDEHGKSSLPVQLAWSKAAEIAYTPTSFFNGRRLPSKLRLEDMRYHVGELLEE